MHHTSDGFANPDPGYIDRGFKDFLKWSVVDRLAGKKPDKPENYNFEMISNDGQFLRENTEEFTVTWIGHSTLLIQIDGINILTDPIWSERCSPVNFAGPKRHVPPGLAFDDLPEIDVVLISHDHYDHLDKATIKMLGNKPLYLVPLGVGAILRDWGMTRYSEMDWWDSMKFNGVEIVCVPAQHFSGRSLFNRNKTLWSGWVVRGKNQNFYFAGDTGYFPGFKEIGKRYGPFDLAALPIGAYLPRWFMGPVHLSPDEAVDAYIDLRAKKFVAIHWGTFELADEPLDEPPKALAQALKEKKLSDNDFWVLNHGETRKLFQSASEKEYVEFGNSGMPGKP